MSKKKAPKGNTTNLEKAKKAGLKLDNKADYVKAHRKLWAGIMRMLTGIKAANHPKKKIPGIRILDIKEYVFEDLYGEVRVSGLCFGCQWSARTGFRTEADQFCSRCLFKLKEGRLCLDGLYAEIEEAVKDKNWPEALRLANRIKNFKVKGSA